MAVIKTEGFDNVLSATFRADCNVGHGKRVNLDRLIKHLRSACDKIYLHDGCDAGRFTVETQKENLFTISRCFDLFINKNIVDALAKERAYLLTPGWLMRWHRYIVDDWGFNKATAREFFAECATKLVLLDTGVNKRSREHLEELADFVGMPSEILPVGLDYFRLYISSLVFEWQLENAKRNLTTISVAASRQTADYAMAFDIIGSLASVKTEVEAIESIIDMSSMLFAPKQIFYIPMIRGEPGTVHTRGPTAGITDKAIQKRVSFAGDYAWTESGNGFSLKIKHESEMLGVLVIDEIAFPEHREHYLNLALTMTSVLGLAVSNARLYEAELTIADTLQEALLVIPEEIEHIEFGQLYRPAMEKTKVGGDFYDIFEIDSNKIGIILGDVAGKGLEAATLTSVARNTIRAYALEGYSPAETISKTNIAVKTVSGLASFVTVFFALLEVKTGNLTYCNAGHPPAIIKRNNLSVELLNEHCIAIGSFRNAKYEETTVILNVGDILILYTDGIIEARDDRNFYGEQRLISFINGLKKISAKRLPQVVFSDVITFTGGKLADDVAMLAVSIKK